MKNVINIAIFAHVDAGKTTITENMLYLSGTNKTLGKVDNGTSSTDSLKIEQERGISIRTSTACFTWQDLIINIIDTPGHIDFSSEIERALFAPDVAILVISAVEGIQAQTESICKILKEKQIPFIFFINKIDRLGANPDMIIKNIREDLSINIILTQKLIESNNSFIAIEDAFTENRIAPNIIDKLSKNDDQLIEMFINNINPPLNLVKLKLKEQIKEAKIYPILYGSAIKNLGIKELLNFIVQYLPYSNRTFNQPLSGIIFKIEHHKTLGRLASIRVFRGKIKNKDMVYNNSLKKEEKVNNVLKIYSKKIENIGVVYAGDIAILTGLKKSRTGDILGNSKFIPKKSKLSVSVIKVLIIPKKKEQYFNLVKALEILTDEDPLLNLQWNKNERELYIKVKGKIQIEVIGAILLSRFNIEVIFGDPIILYKETLIEKTIVFEEYTMPKPCWAIVKFSLSPGKPGSGIKYKSLVSFDKIEQKYQTEIEKALPNILMQGPLGWEVTDIDIELIDGEHHNIHSRAGDFSVATAIAIMKGLVKAKTQLLEPVLKFNIDIHKDFINSITGILLQMRGEISENVNLGDRTVIKGFIPVATSINMPIILASLTGGLGKYQNDFSGYKSCILNLGKTRTYKGINPLDRAKYILNARKALAF